MLLRTRLRYKTGPTSDFPPTTRTTGLRRLAVVLTLAVSLSGQMALLPDSAHADVVELADSSLSRVPTTVLRVEGLQLQVTPPPPVADILSAVSTGEASWYGEYFHGRTTASGEPFDMHAMTAAHRTLPLGTVVLVKRVDTGATVVVTINDRGPYLPDSNGTSDHPTRVIDLSYAAALQLHAVDEGVVDVAVFKVSDIEAR